MRRVPQRSCVACRQVRAKSELIRIVRTPHGEVQIDLSGKLAGRGAYLCRDERCLDQAVKRHRLARALGSAVGAEVTEAMRQALRAS